MTRKFLTPIVLPADPTNPLEAATKQYVDGRDLVWVGTSTPADPAVELWYDTDEPNPGMPRQQVLTYGSTTYTPILQDENWLVVFTAATAIAMTVPLYASIAFSVGARIDLVQIGAGKVTVTGAGGVTVYATPSAVLRAVGSMASLINIALNTWVLTGDLT